MLEKIVETVKNYKTNIIVGSVGLFIGAAIGAGIGLSRAKVEERVEYIEKFQTIIKERIVAVKETQKEKERDIKITKIKAKDGTVTETKEIKEREKEKTKDTKIAETNSKTNSTSSAKKETKITAQPEWHLSFSAGTNIGQLKLNPTSPYISPLVFGVQAEKRIAGSLFLGVYGKTDKSIGITLGGSF